MELRLRPREGILCGDLSPGRSKQKGECGETPARSSRILSAAGRLV